MVSRPFTLKSESSGRDMRKIDLGRGLWMSFVTVETETDTGKCGSGCDQSSKESEQWLAPEGW